jgi:formylglycine-generating enzyme required for sulfatase activity/tRNA A-37 threonylcarbamoyl transferase component Bud32
MQPAPGTLINPRVKLLRPLDEGAMGTVWVAEHLTLATEVAVKFVSNELADDDDILERFNREARAAAQIKSSNVVQMLDHGVTDDGVPYIVMELLEGQTLAEQLVQDNTLGTYETVIVVSQVSRALAKAHALGIIHRDIKPENIFLLEEDEETSGMDDQQVKVLDFGIAKHVEIPEALTIPGMVIGTPGYMCPDQILDSREVDHAADIWSLAVVAYVCLTGELPFYAETMAKLVGKHIKGEFIPATEHRPELPSTVDPFFIKAFAREGRFETAIEMATAFREAVGIASGRGATQPPDDAMRAKMVSSEEMRLSRPSLGNIRVEQGVVARASVNSSARKTGMMVAIGGLVVGIAVVLGIKAFSSDETSPEPAPSAAPTASAPLISATGPWASIAGATFAFGCDPTSRSDCDAETLAPRQLTLDAYRIGRREVTVAEYRRCVEEEGCTVDGLTTDPVHCTWGDDAAAQMPLNCVSWGQASAYCKWAGGALPSEAQWEHAARGEDGRRYPWGDDEPSCSHAVIADVQGPGCGRSNAWQVSSRPQGNSPRGTFDMAGNLREWVADWHAPKLLTDAPATGPASGSERVIRGGGWKSEIRALRSYHREHEAPEQRAADLGFRCMRRRK